MLGTWTVVVAMYWYTITNITTEINGCSNINICIQNCKYTWITYGWYAQASWINEDITEDRQLRKVLGSGISVKVFPIPEKTNAATVAGLVRERETTDSWIAELKE